MSPEIEAMMDALAAIARSGMRCPTEVHLPESDYWRLLGEWKLIAHRFDPPSKNAYRRPLLRRPTLTFNEMPEPRHYSTDWFWVEPEEETSFGFHGPDGVVRIVRAGLW